MHKLRTHYKNNKSTQTKRNEFKEKRKTDINETANNEKSTNNF